MADAAKGRVRSLARRRGWVNVATFCCFQMEFSLTPATRGSSLSSRVYSPGTSMRSEGQNRLR